jgi:hypothetical protein
VPFINVGTSCWVEPALVGLFFAAFSRAVPGKLDGTTLQRTAPFSFLLFFWSIISVA